MTLENLKAWRVLHGLTQAELARRTGMSQSRISEVEHGRSISEASARKLANALGIEVQDFDVDPLAQARARMPA